MNNNNCLDFLVGLSLEKKYFEIASTFQTCPLFREKKSIETYFNYFSGNPQFDLHTYLFIQIAKDIPMNTIHNIFYLFLLNFDEAQIKFEPKIFFDLTERFIDYFARNKNIPKILKVLYFAIDKIKHFGLTPLHFNYLYLCLKTKMYKEGLKLAKQPIGNIYKRASKIRFYLLLISICSTIFRSSNIFLLLQQNIHRIESYLKLIIFLK